MKGNVFRIAAMIVFGLAIAVPQASAQMVLGGAEGDSSLFFFDAGSSYGQSFWWDDSQARFHLTTDLKIDGTQICFGTVECWQDGGGDLIHTQQSLSVNGSLRTNSNGVYLNYDGPDGGSALYFYEGGSPTSRSLFWDDGQNRFEMNDRFVVFQNIIVGTTADVTFNAFNNSTPFSGDMTVDSDLLLEDIEVQGQAYLDATLYMKGRTATGFDGDQTIYFYDTNDRTQNYFRWDDVRADAACSSTSSTNSAFIFGIEDNFNTAWYFAQVGTVFDVELKVDDIGDTAIDGTLVQSGSCDLAETFIGPELEPGTVVVLDKAVPEAVEAATRAYDATFVGVVSTRPGVLLNGPTRDAYPKMREIEETKTLFAETGDPALGELKSRLELELDGWTRGNLPVALAGRLPVKVDGTFGAIRPGDFLTTSSTPGHAMLLDRPGPAIGIALEGFSGEFGTVMMMLQSGWHGGSPEVSHRTGDASNVVGAESAAAAGEDGVSETTVDRETESRLAVGVDLGALRAIGESLAGFQPVIEAVEVGDVLVADRNYEGWMRRSEMAADAAVVGIVTATDGVVLGAGLDRFAELDQQRFEDSFAPVAMSGIVHCKVDASYAAIGVGDLLSTSPTPGHAMRAEAATPGTILGKALESMDNGTGTIRVLVMLR